MAVGRPDEDSEGLLLLTTDDQEMSKRVREKDVEKEYSYWVQVRRQVTEDAMNKLQMGVTISLPASECMKKEDSASDAGSKQCIKHYRVKYGYLILKWWRFQCLIILQTERQL
jgi:pseudouridine synthase